MNILQINKFFYIHGGVSRYFFNLANLLSSHGHEVAFFSMNDIKNQKSKWAKYFVNNISFEKVELKNSFNKFFHLLYSVEARKKISKLLGEFKPDIAHLHSIYHHLSPSIILELKKRNIPIVQTVHDYHLISPNRSLFHNGKICEITKPNKSYKAILHKCIKNSYLASFIEVVEKYLHNFLGWEKDFVDYFIAPSCFMKKKLIEYGIDKEKIVYLPYFIDCQEFIPRYEDDGYILYFGRLSEEKGLEFLIEVIRKLPEIKLKIIGRGSLEEILNKKIRDMKIKNIEMLGFKEGETLKSLIGGSRFTILPSIWYENFPNSILEAFASGKPVVGSKIGGIPELISDGYNGYLFKTGNVKDYQEKVVRLWTNPLLCRKLGKNAREYVERNFGPKEHYDKLIEIYKKALKSPRGGRLNLRSHDSPEVEKTVKLK